MSKTIPTAVTSLSVPPMKGITSRGTGESFDTGLQGDRSLRIYGDLREAVDKRNSQSSIEAIERRRKEGHWQRQTNTRGGQPVLVLFFPRKGCLERPRSWD